MSSILTAAELAALEAEVQKDIDKEDKAKAREKVKQEMMTKARMERGLEELVEDILIDLPESGNEIRVNNFAYRQGSTYRVKASIAIMLRDTMQRAWQHQAEIEGRSRDFFQKLRGTRMSGTTGAVQNAPSFLKV
jgi:hypothetical protein